MMRLIFLVVLFVGMSQMAIAADYRLTHNDEPRDQQIVVRALDGASIPPDSGNVDFRNYLIWLHAGNIPGPAQPELP